VRVDSGIAERSEVTVHYDPLLAKVVAFAETRDAAIARAAAALRAYPILGIRTNIAFLLAILAHPAFRAGEISTAFVDEHVEALLGSEAIPPEVEAAARAYRPSEGAVAATTDTGAATADPWSALTGWGR
jgi:3-methylcrotonyl-CoA carboxylase alpha subunit